MSFLSQIQAKWGIALRRFISLLNTLVADIEPQVNKVILLNEQNSPIAETSTPAQLGFEYRHYLDWSWKRERKREIYGWKLVFLTERTQLLDKEIRGIHHHYSSSSNWEQLFSWMTSFSIPIQSEHRDWGRNWTNSMRLKSIDQIRQSVSVSGGLGGACFSRKLLTSRKECQLSVFTKELKVEEAQGCSS